MFFCIFNSSPRKDTSTLDNKLYERVMNYQYNYKKKNSYKIGIIDRIIVQEF